MRAIAAHDTDAATIRGTAAGAGVDPALVHYYFGTKEDLFGALIQLPLRLSDAADASSPEASNRLKTKL